MNRGGGIEAVKIGGHEDLRELSVLLFSTTGLSIIATFIIRGAFKRMQNRESTYILTNVSTLRNK
ncbi:hypothetical protein YC2023_050862 [Brassica napus]